MAVQRQVVSFVINHAVPSGSTYEQELKTAWDTAISGAGAGDWYTVNFERKDAATYKSSYVLWLEKSS